MQHETLTYHSTQISSLLDVARNHVEQLVLVTGGDWTARTELLQAMTSHGGFEYAAISLPFAKALLGQPPSQRPLLASEMVETLVQAAHTGITLDQIDILFDPELHLDPLRLVRTLSHHRLILLSWPGTFTQSRLIYGEPDQPEYRVYQAGDTLVYSLENSA
jgi:hypothetical protein